MQTLFQDMRYGARMLWKKPGFTLIAVFTLAFSIGANTAIFSVVYSVLLRPLPYPESDRLVWVSEYRQDFGKMLISYPNFSDWRVEQRVFEYIGVYRPGTYNLTGRGTPQRLRCLHLSADIFSALRVQAALGRVFNNDEDKPGAPHVVVLSHALWQSRFGGDTGIVSRSITLDGLDYTVIGVMPVDFGFLRTADIWLPVGPLSSSESWQDRGNHALYGVARLKPGVTLEQARTEMNGIAERLAQQYPGLKYDRVNIEPLLNYTVGNSGIGLWTLLGAVGLVLLIGCVNLANLWLARATTRHREVAVRSALGAGRKRIIRQLLTESVMLALAGGLAGLLVAVWGVPLIQAIGQDVIPRAREINIDSWVLAFTALISVLTGIVFGLAPALQVSRVDVQSVLKDATRGITGNRSKFRQALIVVEVALTLVLLVGAILLLRSFYLLQQVNAGFNPDNVLSFRISLPDRKYDRNEQKLGFYQRLDENLRGLPGVEEVAFASQFPLGGRNFQTLFSIDNQPQMKQLPSLELTVVSPGYFRALGIPLLRGRHFNNQDNLEHQSEETRSFIGANAVIVDEELARRYWPNEDPIGKRISGAPIVGIVARVKMVRLGEQDGLGQAYIPLLQNPIHGGTVLIKTNVEPETMIDAARRQVLALDPELPIYDVRTLSERFANSLAPERLNLTMLVSFGVMALMLAIIGLYGVISYAITQRAHEIGIRIALGAQSRDVLKLVIGQAMKLVLIGILFGLIGALALTHLMQTLLFEVSPTDPISFVLVSFLLAVTGLMACYIPARRATKVDPIVTLRSD